MSNSVTFGPSSTSSVTVQHDQQPEPIASSQPTSTSTSSVTVQHDQQPESIASSQPNPSPEEIIQRQQQTIEQQRQQIAHLQTRVTQLLSDQTLHAQMERLRLDEVYNRGPSEPSNNDLSAADHEALQFKNEQIELLVQFSKGLQEKIERQSLEHNRLLEELNAVKQANEEQNQLRAVLENQLKEAGGQIKRMQQEQIAADKTIATLKQQVEGLVLLNEHLEQEALYLKN